MQKEVKRGCDKRRRKRIKEQKKLSVAEEIVKIKQSNLVKNFSSEETPDSAYAFLALGSTFCTTHTQKLHDYQFDTKIFCRKLAWAAYHVIRKREAEAASNSQLDISAAPTVTAAVNDAAKVNSWTIPSKLRIKSRKNPDLNDKLLDCITQKITDSVNHIELPKKKRSNLTVLEADGMKWCKKAMSERRLYFSRVDKGGCILILNADDVHKIMLDTLDSDEKFEKLENDPRNEVKKKIKNAIKGYTE